ncbi:J domain-containing protein [Pontixanthobacter aquaemixtae]|uniref:Molecular chaperone DnaJ n=1 Tax=Pontixanthobacter aquaemixtae TaxID=1958940 RepID=A0A844ZWE8_9SPHN|nr:molecular chaperone DnaJ [Pontixanthobacter aquaemixtae]MXO91276.1 molecular chaperone DnaJ [Pontixanthobacter aquaemixtae]
MLRLLLFAGLACLACRLIFGKWPWQFAQSKSTRAQALFRARKLLGVRENATRQEVLQAHKQLIAMVHPDKGGTNDQVHEANAARDLLLNELPYPTPDKP